MIINRAMANAQSADNEGFTSDLQSRFFFQATGLDEIQIGSVDG